jgi:hypothetical protein
MDTPAEAALKRKVPIIPAAAPSSRALDQIAPRALDQIAPRALDQIAPRALDQIAPLAPVTAPTPPAVHGSASQATGWFLGFDCATKTFAFSLSHLELGSAESRADAASRIRSVLELLARASVAKPNRPQPSPRALLAVLAPIVEDLELATSRAIVIADGETVDLCPGRADKDIPTVERLRAVVNYVNTRIRPALAKHVPPGEKLNVVIEYQMGQNFPARAVSSALVTLFASDEVIIVGPSLKNKIATCEEGRYCYFAERYKTTYGANKAHASYNFGRVEATFGTSIVKTNPPSLRGHIADSFMQVLGHIVHGHLENGSHYF